MSYEDWMRLPLDSKGEPISVGEVVRADGLWTGRVVAVGEKSVYVMNVNHGEAVEVRCEGVERAEESAAFLLREWVAKHDGMGCDAEELLDIADMLGSEGAEA